MKEMTKNMMLTNLCEDLTTSFPGCEFTVREVEKTTRTYLGLEVSLERGSIRPVFDLTPYLELSEDAYEEILFAFKAKIEREIERTPDFGDVGQELTNWEYAKGHLILQAMDKKGKEEFLANIPHREVLDMAIIYRVVIEHPENFASTVVTNELLGKWTGVDENTLFECARENHPLKFRDLLGVLVELNPGYGLEGDEDRMIYIASYDIQSFGAGVIAYPELLEKAKACFAQGFYILPSSIHEILIAPGDASMKEDMLDMVKSINESILSPDEKLTDNAYWYSPDEDELVAIA